MPRERLVHFHPRLASGRSAAAAVALLLTAVVAGCLLDSEVDNRAPVITSLTAEPQELHPSEQSTLTVVASDCACQSLSFRWRATAGSFVGGADLPVVTWQAPDTIGPCTLSVRVSDGELTDSASLVIEVVPVVTPVWGYTVVDSLPHDTGAFTQGFLFYQGLFYEGTGGYNGRSSIREVAPETGEILRLRPLSPYDFGEGLTLLEDRLYQITWRERRGYVYDRATFAPLDTFSLRTVTREGWGLTDDGSRLIMSDGSHRLYFVDPWTYANLDTVEVRDLGVAVDDLNELEFVAGEVWANVWKLEKVARIAPETGEVVGWIDLTGLKARVDDSPGADVLNGIAHDPATGRIFVTGKRWPRAYQIALVAPRRAFATPTP